MIIILTLVTTLLSSDICDDVRRRIEFEIRMAKKKPVLMKSKSQDKMVNDLYDEFLDMIQKENIPRLTVRRINKIAMEIDMLAGQPKFMHQRHFYILKMAREMQRLRYEYKVRGKIEE